MNDSQRARTRALVGHFDDSTSQDFHRENQQTQEAIRASNRRRHRRNVAQRAFKVLGEVLSKRILEKAAIVGRINWRADKPTARRDRPARSSNLQVSSLRATSQLTTQAPRHAGSNGAPRCSRPDHPPPPKETHKPIAGRWFSGAPSPSPHARASRCADAYAGVPGSGDKT